jgi:hypothetical protein
MFDAFSDTLPMIVFPNFYSILIKSYKTICRPNLLGVLRVLLVGIRVRRMAEGMVL